MLHSWRIIHVFFSWLLPSGVVRADHLTFSVASSTDAPTVSLSSFTASINLHRCLLFFSLSPSWQLCLPFNMSTLCPICHVISYCINSCQHVGVRRTGLILFLQEKNTPTYHWPTDSVKLTLSTRQAGLLQSSLQRSSSSVFRRKL